MNFKNFLIAGFSLMMISCGTRRDIFPKVAPTLVSDRFSFTERPASDRSGNVYFTDQPNDKIYRWDAESGKITEFLEHAGRANGTYFNAKDELVTCSDEDGELLEISKDKSEKILAKGYEGKRFNGPNDLWIAHSGGIYFTDPLYMRDYWKNFHQEIPTKNLYYRNPSGEILRLDAFQQPNGIIGSEKFHKLYVSDIDAGKTYVYDISADGSLKNKSVFVAMGSDGMTMDNRGNVYLTGDGVTVFSAKGKKMGHISILEKWTANVTFGGRDFHTLFITASKSVYTLRLPVKKVR